jgi:thioredoxin 2
MLDGTIHVTCPLCRVVNRLQVSHLLAEPRCGRCHAPLLASEMAAMSGAASLAQQIRSENKADDDGDSP